MLSLASSSVFLRCYSLFTDMIIGKRKFVFINMNVRPAWPVQNNTHKGRVTALSIAHVMMSRVIYRAEFVFSWSQMSSTAVMASVMASWKSIYQCSINGKHCSTWSFSDSVQRNVTFCLGVVFLPPPGKEGGDLTMASVPKVLNCQGDPSTGEEMTQPVTAETNFWFHTLNYLTMGDYFN